MNRLLRAVGRKFVCRQRVVMLSSWKALKPSRHNPARTGKLPAENQKRKFSEHCLSFLFNIEQELLQFVATNSASVKMFQERKS